MKKKYIELELSIIKLDINDVLAVSGEGFDIFDDEIGENTFSPFF